MNNRTTLLCLLVALLCGGTRAAAEIEIVAGAIPPYVYQKDGKTLGIVAELVQAMAARVGHSGKITFYPWMRAQQIARKPGDGQPKLIVPLNRSAEREKDYAWVTGLVVDETMIITREKGKPPVTDVKAALDYRIGVLAGSPLSVQLSKLGFRSIEPGMDEAANAKKLARGRLDAWFVAGMVAPFVYKQEGLDPSELRYGVKLDLNDLHLGATLTLPDAEKRRWSDAFQAIKADGTLERIVRAYRPGAIAGR